MIPVLGAALTGAVAWNGLTWWRGLPRVRDTRCSVVSSAPELAEGGAGSVDWGGFDGIKPVGVLGVAGVLTIAPAVGLVAGLLVDRALRRPRGGAHGVYAVGACRAVADVGGSCADPWPNDAQKAVGVVALLLVAVASSHTSWRPYGSSSCAVPHLPRGPRRADGGSCGRSAGAHPDPSPRCDLEPDRSSAVLLGASVLGAAGSTTQSWRRRWSGSVGDGAVGAMCAGAWCGPF